MKRHELTKEYLINGWMVKYHGLTIAEAYEKEPWDNSDVFYDRYQVTKEQHDEWYDWAIETLMKVYRMSKKRAKLDFCYIYLNTAPTIKKDDNISE